MAKQRFNLSETMLDARQGIEEARANAEKAGEGSALPQTTEESSTVITSVAPCDEGAGLKESACPEQQTEDDKEKVKNGTAEKKISSIRKRMRKDEKDERIMRNVYLDEDMLEKLEDIKKRMNKGRSKDKKDAFVSVIDLLNVAAQEFLDKYYKDIVES